MAVSRLFSDMDEVISEVLNRRSAPDDSIEWEMSLIPVVADCEEHGPLFELAVGLIIRIEQPGMEKGSIVYLSISMEDTAPAALSAHIEGVWDRLVLHRMSMSDSELS